MDSIIELAILEREILARIRARLASEQLGEAFIGLDTDWRSSYIAETGIPPDVSGVSEYGKETKG